MTAQTQTPIAATVAANNTSIATTHRGAALSAMLLGSALLFLVGFAPMPAVHNAAHDTRHSAAFPCH
jgi:cobalt transporter subunit CbtB